MTYPHAHAHFLFPGKQAALSFSFPFPEVYLNFFRKGAMNAVPSPTRAMREKDHRREEAWAMWPMTGGPSRKPRKPMVETEARATLGIIFLDFPAML